MQIIYHSCIMILLLILPQALKAQELPPPVPQDKRGRVDAERSGMHDANRIRTVFYNFGMVGDYPPDPVNVDLSVFHSVEVPKGTGENYSDGTTPFVLAKIRQNNGRESYIMETGFRERQQTSPRGSRVMRFEPRPGYFQEKSSINVGRSVAMSNDKRTWPDEWIDKLNDPDDPGWKDSWNGYFGKAPGADQESFVVYDDDFYDAWDYYPDARDNTRRGLGLRVEQRGFQWANPQAGNVIFFHYDITNESTTDYNDNIIFGLYMDSGVGGSSIGRDGIPESDDDNAFFDRSIGLNLVYTWDKTGYGKIGPTGYLGYSYLETPGNSTDGKDNDQDGVLDEKRDGGPGEKIVGQDAILAYVNSHYDVQKFEAFNGPVRQRPAFIIGTWFSGDEDMDWIAEFHDTGADGVFGTNDTGEKDGIPTRGEPYFDRTDVDESDQIGLTGFKMNRIRAGQGASDTRVDNIVFFDDGKEWPKRLYNIFTNPDSSFDVPLVQNFNIGFLFASGPFKLASGKTERFSLALGFGKDLRELRNTTRVVQQIYKANYQFAVPPPMPSLDAFPGDGYVVLNWDDAAERAFDPVTNTNDFEGYRLYRSTDPAFLDPQVIFTGTGTGPIGNGRPIAQYDLKNGINGYSGVQVEGVAYFLGEDTGLRHTFRDTTVVNGQRYFYAITAYDRGTDSTEIYPSENAIAVTQTLRGGTILPKNVVVVYPNAQVPGYVPASAAQTEHSAGRGVGTVNVEIKNSMLVPDGHTFQIEFSEPGDSVRAQNYSMIDVTLGDTLFTTGTDIEGEGRGPVALGLLPVVQTPRIVSIDTVNSGFVGSSTTNARIRARYQTALNIGLRRPGYPNDIEIRFSNAFVDTSVAAIGVPKKPAKFQVWAKTNTGDVRMKFRFFDPDNNGTLSRPDEYIEVLTYARTAPNTARATWSFSLDTTGQYRRGALQPPSQGDIYYMTLNIPFSSEDKFTFKTTGQRTDLAKLKSDYNQKPYVVPNPYVAAASFEPQRFAVSGRGERRMEFRNLPASAKVRIYTVNGELVQTLEQNGNINQGYVVWDLRTKDNLEIAPGLYIYHVEAVNTDPYIGKFAVIK